MLKIFFKISLVTVLGVLMFGGIVVAQTKEPNDCCKARATFQVTVGNTEYTINSGAYIITDTAGPVCDLDQDGITDNLGTDPLKDKDWGFFCFLATIHLVTKWLFVVLMLFVTIMIIYGGFLIITSAGDPEKSCKGRKVVTYAAIGLAVALLARVIPSLVRFVIGV